MTVLQFRVYGTPGAQGSKNARPIYRGKGAARQFTGHVAQQESSKKVKPWRADVKAAAEAAVPAGWRPLDEPLAILVVFIFPRPKSHYRTGRNAHLLRDDAPMRPVSKGVGDNDKLQRSTFDALTDAGIWRDDCLAADVKAHKVYGSRPGARITIGPAEYVPEWIGDESEGQPPLEVRTA